MPPLDPILPDVETIEAEPFPPLEAAGAKAWIQANPESVAAFLMARSLGVPLAQAAEGAGVHERTVINTRNTGRRVHDNWLIEDQPGLERFVKRWRKRRQEIRAELADTEGAALNPRAYGLGIILPPKRLVLKRVPNLKRRTPFLQFFLAEAVVTLSRLAARLQTIEAASPKDWRAAAWLIEKELGKDFGAHVTLHTEKPQPPNPEEALKELQDMEARLGIVNGHGERGKP